MKDERDIVRSRHSGHVEPDVPIVVGAINTGTVLN